VKKIPKKSEKLISMKITSDHVMNNVNEKKGKKATETFENFHSYGCALFMVIKLLEKSLENVDIASDKIFENKINIDNDSDNNNNNNNNNNDDNYNNNDNDNNDDKDDIENILFKLNSTKNVNLNINYFEAKNNYNSNNDNINNSDDDNNNDNNNYKNNNNQNKSNNNNDNNNNDNNLIDKIRNVFYNNRHLYNFFSDINESHNFKEESRILW
jgi:hypothetical protein